mmetsp:Transcript_24300/g.72590  ORF Transcript_24300/g.72590 Transcript_24300/m.72590 type:complete len:261 (+) Transcript_24300:903-1685(+)
MVCTLTFRTLKPCSKCRLALGMGNRVRLLVLHPYRNPTAITLTCSLPTLEVLYCVSCIGPLEVLLRSSTHRRLKLRPLICNFSAQVKFLHGPATFCPSTLRRRSLVLCTFVRTGRGSYSAMCVHLTRGRSGKLVRRWKSIMQCCTAASLVNPDGFLHLIVLHLSMKHSPCVLPPSQRCQSLSFCVPFLARSILPRLKPRRPRRRVKCQRCLGNGFNCQRTPKSQVFTLVKGPTAFVSWQRMVGHLWRVLPSPNLPPSTKC